jgi:5'-deoxynucleotidase
MRNTSTENIAQHSLEVAMIAHGLCVIANTFFGEKLNPDRAMVLAVYHDASEVITGDMPTPIKYFSSSIRQSYQEIEQVANEKIMAMLPDQMKLSYVGLFEKQEEKDLWLRVKAADKLSAYIKCLEEMKAGNREFVKAAESIRIILDSNPLPEVKYFMDNFIESFSLTLDEQE